MLVVSFICYASPRDQNTGLWHYAAIAVLSGKACSTGYVIFCQHHLPPSTGWAESLLAGTSLPQAGMF